MLSFLLGLFLIFHYPSIAREYECRTAWSAAITERFLCRLDRVEESLIITKCDQIGLEGKPEEAYMKKSDFERQTYPLHNYILLEECRSVIDALHAASWAYRKSFEIETAEFTKELEKPDYKDKGGMGHVRNFARNNK